MKHIMHINEFFDFLKKSEEDNIALEFIKRLEKVKTENPYEIKVLCKQYSTGYDDVPQYMLSITGRKLGDLYQVTFDDVILETLHYQSGGYDTYHLFIDEEQIDCKDRYKKKIFNLIDDIHNSNIKRIKLDKLKSNINPAADRL